MKEKPGRKAGKLMDKTVFGFFNSFVNTDDEARVRGACGLIEFLSKDGAHKQSGVNGSTTEESSPKTAEKAYALKRLVRGVGSTSNASRAGFFTGLVGLLNQLKQNSTADCPSVTELFSLVKSELSETTDTQPANEKESDGKEKTRFELRVGKILVCGAIVKAGLIAAASDSELETVLKTLKNGMYKMLTPMVFTFLNELVPQLSVERFTKVFWPQFESVLNVPKEQHTMDSIHFLLLLSNGTHRKMVNKKYFERNFGAPKLLHPDTFPYISGVLFNIRTAMGINHPFYVCLLEQLIQQGSLVQFVRDAIVPVLEQPEETRPKYRDIIVLQLLLSALGRLEDYACVPELLQPALMKFLTQNLKNCNQYSEDVREMYQDTCKALMDCYPKMQEESDRISTFRRLTQAPSSILIEKYASSKLLQNLLATLSAESLQTIATELKALVVNESATATVTNAERSYAAQMLQRLYSLRQFTAGQQKDKQQADEQRLEVVRFFLTLGVFYSADGVQVLKSAKHDRAISQELATTLRGLFFHSLDHRHASLAHERNFLYAIVRHVHETLQANGGVKSLRNPLTDDQFSCWNRMYATVAKEQAKNRSAASKLDTVFHILLMHMGLHLFSDPELATSSLTELECVMKRVGSKNSKDRRLSNGQRKEPAEANGAGREEGADEEPEWIEVVIDLFLNLLSQNSHLLRNVIAHVFPHLSGEMTLAAFNQILSVINLKDKTNPLTAEGQEEAEEEEEMEEEEEKESDEESNDGDEDEQENDENGEDEGEEDDDDEELMGDEEEEETISDKMRLAVQQALGGANPDTDTESVDLDELDEEQGRKLDAALADAFRAFRQAKTKSGSKKKGPTKAELQVETVLKHFRMRVFDLIDAYLKHEPDMILCLELMLYVFEMLPIAIREEAKYGAILQRYNQIFNALIRIKQFRGGAQDVGAERLNQILRDLIEKVAKGGVAFPERNQYLLKACQFIIICSQTLERNEDSPSKELQVDKIFGDLLAEFLTNRNPSLAFTVFQSIFRMPWRGNWHLAVRAATGGLKVGSVRGIRRIQALQLLRELLRNRRFVSLEHPLVAANLRTICTDAITPYVAELSDAIASGNRTVGQNELHELLQLLLDIHRYSSVSQQQQQQRVAGVENKGKKQQQQQQSLLQWDHIGQQLQAMRRFPLNSQTMSGYRELCNRLGLTPIGNADLLPVEDTRELANGTVDKGGKKKGEKNQEKAAAPVNGSMTNGHVSNGHATDEDEEMASEAEEAEQSSSKTNGANRKRTKDQALKLNGEGATKEKSSKKEKRKRKEARLQQASAGMEAISFASEV